RADAVREEPGTSRQARRREGNRRGEESHVSRVASERRPGMATKVMMEALSPTMEEGRLVKWLKNEGDQVKNGETLAEVETDKAIMELVARGDGVLRKRLLAEDTAAPVGQLIAVIAGADENIDALIGGAGAPAAAEAPNAPAQPTSVPKAAAQSQGE